MVYSFIPSEYTRVMAAIYVIYGSLPCYMLYGMAGISPCLLAVVDRPVKVAGIIICITFIQFIMSLGNSLSTFSGSPSNSVTFWEQINPVQLMRISASWCQ